MDNRFGFKDLVVVGMLAALIVVVLLAMVQYDRQWGDVQSMERQLAEQNKALIALGDTLRAGSGDAAILRQIDARLAEQGEALRAIAAALQGGGAANAALPGDALASLTPRVEAGGSPGEASANRTAAGVTSLAPEEYFYRVMEPRERPDFAYGDWFVDTFGQAVGKLTPLISTDVYQRAVEGYVLESLITRDPDTLEWRPWIARDWEVSEDGLTISFDLREDVRFSDGRPLTSEDVLYTFELINNPEINAPRLRSYYENVASVEADGPYRVVFGLKEPYFLSLSITGGTPILAKHFYERFTPEEFNASTGLLFGSGPYRLAVDPEDWRPGEGQIELVRNERYWGPRPTFDRLVWREIPDETASLVEFRNRRVDRYGVRPEQYHQLKGDPSLLEHADLYEYETPTGGYRYLGWNQLRGGKPTPFADARVRRAMTLLTNRQEMAQQLMQGLATVASGPFHPLGEQDDPSIEPWPYDPERARELLAEAGWVDRDNDRVLENEAGEELRFKLIYSSSIENYKQMAFYLKDAYARAGVVLEPDPTEWNTMIQRIDERDFDAITLGWGGTVESDPKQIFHGESTLPGGDNYVNYRNAELDRLIDEARTTVDVDERNEKWRRVHRILHEDQPYTFLFNSKAVVFMDDRIRNVQVTRTGINDRTEMYVPLELQRWAE